MESLIELLAISKPKMYIEVVFNSLHDAKIAFKDNESKLNWLKREITNFCYTFPNQSIVKFTSYQGEMYTRGIHRQYLIIPKETNLSNEIYYQLRVRTQFAVINLNQ